MKEFTKAGFKKVRTVLDKALEKAGKELDITLELGSISFDANKFTCKLTALTGTDTHEHAKKEWDKNCVMFGFKPSHFGVSHKPKFGHDTYTIVGINPRARKNPITVTVVGKGDSKWVVPCDRFRDLVGVNTDFF